ncbi:MAG TPA: thiamine pyrophosphate-dependent enzyme, partial [SAR202 cluster bacterium]|nr:thiamine pyrophosphate-dependent enzyme [SAR202 cluster bacterium]
SGQIGAVLRRAFHGMRNGSGGPMTVETPGDIAGAEVPDSVIENYKPAKRTIVSPSLSDVKDAVKIFLAAKNPVIWVGGGVIFGGACAELKELAELTGVPVYTTMQGKSAFPEDHELSLGAGSGATTLPASTWLRESDVLLGLGTSLTKTNYGQAIPPGKTIIHNTENIDEINKDESVEVGLPGDVKVTIQMLLDEVKAAIGEGGRTTDAAARIAELRTKWMADWTPLLTSDENPLNHYRVIHEIDTNLDKANSVVTHDAGTPRDTIIPFYHATKPGGYVGWGKTTHLGFGIPLMIGTKIANPDKFCLNFMGDAAFGHSSIDIEVSARIGAPITTVVLNNAGMATYPSGYEAAQERFGVTNMTGNYADMAEAMGATGLIVKTPDEMGPALVEAQKLNADGKTVLIDVNAGFESKRSRF